MGWVWKKKPSERNFSFLGPFWGGQWQGDEKKLKKKNNGFYREFRVQLFVGGWGFFSRGGGPFFKKGEYKVPQTFFFGFWGPFFFVCGKFFLRFPGVFPQ